MRREVAAQTAPRVSYPSCGQSMTTRLYSCSTSAMAAPTRFKNTSPFLERSFSARRVSCSYSMSSRFPGTRSSPSKQVFLMISFSGRRFSSYRIAPYRVSPSQRRTPAAPPAWTSARLVDRDRPPAPDSRPAQDIARGIMWWWFADRSLKFVTAIVWSFSPGRLRGR